MSALSFLPKHLRLVLFICLIYLFAWLSYNGQITLGEYISHEDSRALSGTQSSEYITLYGKLISTFSLFTDNEASRLSLTRTLNGLAFMLAAFFCATTAGHFWKSHRAACAAALFIGMNPVLVFRTSQITPTSLAVLCVAIFLWRIIPWLRQAKTIDSFTIGSALAIGALFETSLIGIALIWPVAAFLYPTRHKTLHLILGTIPAATIFALVAVSDLQLHQPLILDPSNMGAKLYGFVSNQEVDHGISYDIHSKLHMLLLLNPIHWGLLLLVAAGGFYARIKDGHKGYSVYTGIIVITIFWFTYALIGGEGQNRLALTPLLAVFAAGSITSMPRIWKHAGTQTRRKITIGAATLALLTYTGYFINTPSSETKETNYSYMAEACIELGKSETAVTWAEKALETNRERLDMRNIIIRAQFNEWATVSKPKPLSIESVKSLLEAIASADPSDPTIASIKGFYLWKLKDQEAATALWKANASASALAQVGILWSQDKETAYTLNRPVESTPYYDLLSIANQVDRSALTYTKEERLIDNLFAEAH